MDIMQSGTDRRVRRTKLQLQQGLIALMLQKPLDQISTRELADKCDISRTTFYLHYRNIRELLDEIEQEMLSAFTDALNSKSMAELRRDPEDILLFLFTYVQQNRDRCVALMGKSGDSSFPSKLKEAMWKKWQSERLLCNNELASARERYTALYLFNGCIGMMREWMATGMRQSAAELADITKDIILNGVRQ